MNMDWSPPTKSFTCFEDLSNEMIYEIFEYLDFCYTYQTFSQLNHRYYHLIHHSTVSIKLIIPSMSHKIFQNLSKDFFVINQHRIHSIYSTNPFLFDLSPSPFRYLFQFLQLHTLILENFESNHLSNLLSQLSVLPNLSSLIIKPFNSIQRKDNLYQQIFRLPVLKYCQVSFREQSTIRSLPICTNQFSKIERLILVDGCKMNELLIILTYLPQLHRLSCHDFQPSTYAQYNRGMIVLNYLTHLTLRTTDVTLADLEMFLTKLTHQIQVFQFSIQLASNPIYTNSNRWETIIRSHLPRLRIFDLQVLQTNIFNGHQPVFLINQFLTSFWLERKWFFRCEYDHQNALFYSIQPYRRNFYTWNNKSYRETRSTSEMIETFSSVRHLCIQGDISNRRNSIRFPNVVELKLDNYANESLYSISMVLDRVIPLSKLSKISLLSAQFCISQLMDLLYFSPNIRFLTLASISLAKISLTQIRQSQTFQTIFKVNQINQVTLTEHSTFESIELFLYLCPRLEQLSIDVTQYKATEIRHDIVHLITSHYVPVLCLLQADPIWSSLLRRDLPRDECMKFIDSKLYLWS